MGKFFKKTKRAGQNRRAVGKFSGKSINVQGEFEWNFQKMWVWNYQNLQFTAIFIHMNQLATNSHLKWMETFWKINNPASGNKHSGWNIRAGGNFFSKWINMLTKIRPCRGEFFLKINKCACMSIWYTKSTYQAERLGQYRGSGSTSNVDVQTVNVQNSPKFACNFIPCSPATVTK